MLKQPRIGTRSRVLIAAVVTLLAALTVLPAVADTPPATAHVQTGGDNYLNGAEVGAVSVETLPAASFHVALNVNGPCAIAAAHVGVSATVRDGSPLMPSTGNGPQPVGVAPPFSTNFDCAATESLLARAYDALMPAVASAAFMKPSPFGSRICVVPAVMVVSFTGRLSDVA